MQKLTSKDRILRTIAGEPVDRIPIWPPITWHPLLREPEPGHWKAHPNYQEVIRLASEYCDFLIELKFPQTNSQDQGTQDPILQRVFGGGYFDRRFFLTPPELIEETVEPTQAGGQVTTYTVHTPQGALQSKERTDPTVDTVWTIEPLLKNPDDAEKLLSVSYRFEKPDLENYFVEVKKLGDRGLPVCFVSTPMVMISHLMEFQKFFEWVVTERALLERMLETIYERIAERLQTVLDLGVGPLFRFGGSEQATPPMMSKRLFDSFILQYEARLWKMVREAGQIVWVHCHGKINTVIDDFVGEGVQLLDPVEPPPQGNIEIGEAKKRAEAGPMTLIGNIEFSDLCHLAPDEIETLVQRAVCKGGRQHFILGTSDFPISEVDDPTRDNLIRFIEAGVRYGTFPDL